jgi:hypothetical protein
VVLYARDSGLQMAGAVHRAAVTFDVGA